MPVGSTTTPRELVKRALDFLPLDRIPTELDDVLNAPYKYGRGVSSGIIGVRGRRTDIWGCVWESAEDGVCGEVKSSPLENWAALDSFQPPWDVLEEADMSMVNEAAAATDKFVISFWDPNPNPFERMQHLRGTANLYMDLAYGEAEVWRLRDMLHEYFMKQLEMWVSTDVDGVHLVDDWGSQTSLLISPKTWREFYKPLYREYCDLAHSRGKYVVMHSDGYIVDIIPDLIEIGVNALNSQLFCMDIEALAERFHGRMAFWGEIDRQHILTYGTVDETRAAVRRVAQAFLKYGRTGIVGQCPGGKGHRPENEAAVNDEWSRI